MASVYRERAEYIGRVVEHHRRGSADCRREAAAVQRRQISGRLSQANRSNPLGFRNGVVRCRTGWSRSVFEEKRDVDGKYFKIGSERAAASRSTRKRMPVEVKKHEHTTKNHDLSPANVGRSIEGNPVHFWRRICQKHGNIFATRSRFQNRNAGAHNHLMAWLEYLASP